MQMQKWGQNKLKSQLIVFSIKLVPLIRFVPFKKMLPENADVSKNSAGKAWYLSFIGN